MLAIVGIAVLIVITCAAICIAACAVASRADDELADWLNDRDEQR